MTAPAYKFGDFRLDGNRFELVRDGRRLKLERKPMELLLLLAEGRGRLVTRQEIVELLWKGEVFVDTEHGINTAVRKIRTVLKDDPENPMFVQTVTGKGYRFVATVVKEYTEPSKAQHLLQSEAQTAVVSPSSSIPPIQEKKTSRRIWISIATAVAVLAATTIEFAGPSGMRVFRLRQPAISSIAVIPLDNLSGDPKQDYYADGMTDELITMLARDSTLRITSRTSVMQYKGAHRPLRDIAQALNVDAIVEGSVELTGNHVHMNLQLIRAETDSHIWANSYDRDNNDTSTLPDVAAREIAAQLNKVAETAKPVKRVNPEAHDAFLRGQYLWYVGPNEESGKYFQKAVDIDPNYAAGWAGLSEYLDMRAMNGQGNSIEILAKAETAARKAVELDDSLVLAHNNLGASLLFNHWDAASALKEVNRAIELDERNSQALHLKAKILCAENQFEAANQVQAQSTAANPFAHPGARAEIYDCTRQYDKAIQEGQLRLRGSPTAYDILGVLANAYHWKGDDRRSVDYLARWYDARGNHEQSDVVRRAFREGGYRAVLEAELEFLEKGARAGTSLPVQLARLEAMLGQRDEAIEYLKEAADEHAPLLVFFLNNPCFDSLHNDKRFQAIATRVGLPYKPPS